MSINRNLATFAKDVQTDGSLKGIAVIVTVASVGGSNKYHIDGTAQQDMFIPKGVKYRFDVSDSSMSNHPLRFSTTSDGTHGGGSAYTTGVTTSGTAGSAGAYVEVQFQQDAPDQLYYYCGNHSGMGAGAETAPVSAYGDSDVDSHLNQSNPTSGYVLSWNGSDYAWVDNAGYTDADVNTHLNQSNPTSGYVLSWNGSDYAWVDNASYTDADVNTHLNVSGASSGQILSWNGSDYAWADDQSGSGGIASVLADSTPQLGGSLDVNGNAIVSASNGNIAITPNGSGKIVLDGLSWPTSDGTANYVLKTDGSGNLSWAADNAGSSGLDPVNTHSQTISSNTTIAATDNGFSVGPVSIASGVTLTISSGARYAVI